MKKSLLALAALTAFTGVASAQSSVTLFGIVDLAARNVKNGNAGSLKTLSTNGQASSRLGFRGIEDLGGGMRAIFWLEGDISADVGGGGKAAANANGSTADAMNWTRRATVALAGGFGELRMGRDYTPTFGGFSTFDPFGYVGVASAANVRGGLFGTATSGTSVRANNTISYFLPAMGGLYGQGQVAAGEGATGNRYMGGRLGYAAGPINVSGSWGKTDKTGAMVDDQTTMNFGASFNAGFATFQGVYEKNEYSTFNQKLLSLSTIIPMGAGTLKAQYTTSSGSNDYKAKQLGLGYVYALSKRTSLYTNYGSIKNTGSTNNTVGPRFTSSSGGPAGMGRGQTSTGYEFGVRHDF